MQCLCELATRSVDPAKRSTAATAARRVCSVLVVQALSVVAQDLDDTAVLDLPAGGNARSLRPL